MLCIEKTYPQVFPELNFFQLTDKDGLSDNYVCAIAQDRDGLIWVGTHNGLNRYDGYGFKNFYSKANDSFSLPNNYIASIVPDQNDNLWVSTNEGVFRFNTSTQRARSFRSDPDDGRTFRNMYRPAIFLDSGQLPWVNTYDGIYQFKDSLHYVRQDEGLDPVTSFLQVTSNKYFTIYKDRQGGLWSRMHDFVFRLDNQTKRVLKVYKCPDHIEITHIFFDRQNHCWVSTWGNGIYRFTPEQNGWQLFEPSKTRPVVHGASEMEINGRQYLVFSCLTPELFFVDEENLTCYNYLFDASRVSIFDPPFVDRQNILWVPTSNGIYYATPSNHLFSVIPIPAQKKGQVQGRRSFVYNMREEPSGYWFSKRGYGGLVWYDKNWTMLHYWPEIPIGSGEKFHFLGKTTREVFDFMQVGNEMFITTEGGISILDLKTLRWTTASPQDMVLIPRLRTIVPVNDHEWWIRSFNQGVWVFDPISKSFSGHYKNDDSSRNGFIGNVNFLLCTRKHRVYATTELGMFEYDEKSDRFQKIPFPGKPAPSNSLFGMLEDDQGDIWIGADNGIFSMNPVSKKMGKAFLENPKLSYVFRMCTDKYQNVWFSCNSGYWCWIRKSDKLIHFEYGAGLPKTDECIIYKTSDGMVYAGGKDAVVRFFPEDVVNYHVTASTRIVEAITNDTLSRFELNPEGQKLLNLSPYENSFQVNFDVNNYDPISSNQYFYKLVPGEKDWKQVENGHLSFYNMQPGSYRLETRGASLFASDFTNTDTLTIIISPHWYQSIWLKLLCGLVLACIITLGVRYRIHSIRKEAAFRQKIKEVEMTALRAQMNPHFIFNCLNSIENFIMQNEKRLASDYLNKFARLIRMILENSRKQSVPLSKDMYAIRLYVELEQLRFNHSFCYIADIEQVLMEGDYRVAPLLIQPFVENAIVHGLAPSEKRDLYLRISVKLQGEYITYSIEDNGIGRSQSRVYAEMNTKGHKSLGLEITRERIDVINRQQGAEGVLEIQDLQDDYGQPTGTRVLLTIKAA